jgi:hypothetical protein
MSIKILETFQSTMRTCFDLVLKTMLGQKVGEGVYDLLEREGIQRSDISARFDDVVSVLNRAFGTSARVLVHKIAVGLYTEYSAWPRFTFYDSLTDQILLLRDKVISDRLTPRHTLTIDHQSVPKPVPESNAKIIPSHEISFKDSERN